LGLIGKLAALLGGDGKKRQPGRRMPRRAISELPADRPAGKQPFGRAGVQTDAPQRKRAIKRGG
jgi:hypothetical protein